MKSMITKLAAITMGPLVALALFGGTARSVTSCGTTFEDAFFYASHLKVIKGTTPGTDAFTFLGNLVNEDPTAECFYGLDPVNGCNSDDEKGDDFVLGGQPATFVLNNNAVCNTSDTPSNYFFFSITFKKLNNTYAYFKGNVQGSLDGTPVTVNVNAQVWRVGNPTPPNYNYSDDTCGNFRFAIQVLGVDLQGHDLAANPLTFVVNFGNEVTNPGTQSFGCFQTRHAQICTEAKGRDGANYASCD